MTKKDLISELKYNKLKETTLSLKDISIINY